MFFDKLNLVDLAAAFHESDRLVGIELESFEDKILLDDLLHFRLDRFKDLGSEVDLGVKVIVKSAVDRRADRELRVRVKPFHRLRENVRAGVIESLFAFVVVEREDLDLGVRIERCAKILDLAVHS